MAPAKVIQQKLARQKEERPAKKATDIDTVCLLTKSGVRWLVGEDATDTIKEIRAACTDKKTEVMDDSSYMFFENGRVPVYVACKNGNVTTLDFPEPKDYGETAPELYSKAVTYRDAVARLINLRTKGKVGALDQAKKIMTLALPIVVLAFIVFIMAVLLGGKP
jgi:hypothetical protein